MEPDMIITTHIASRNFTIPQYFKFIRRLYTWPVTIFGVGMKWNYTRLNENGSPTIEMIDICTSTGYCLLLEAYRFVAIPSIIQNFLQSKDIIKTGFGITEDVELLKKSQNVAVESAVDVRHLLDEEGIDPSCENQIYKVLGEQPFQYDPTRFVLRHQSPSYLNKINQINISKRSSKATAVARVFTSLTMRRARETLGYKDWQLLGDSLYECAVEFWKKYYNLPFDPNNCKYQQKELVNLMIELGDTCSRPAVSQLHSRAKFIDWMVQ